MKPYSFTTVLAGGLALIFLITGCHPRPQNERTIFGRRGERVQDIDASPISGSLLPQTEEAPFIGIPPTNLGREDWARNPEMFAGSTVYFDLDSSVVKGAEKSKLTPIADYLKANPVAAVEVQGHCDERGTEGYNRSLGERRALALREDLVRLGIDPTRVDTISYGEDRPADPGHNETAWRKNRRGEFILLTPPQSTAQ